MEVQNSPFLFVYLFCLPNSESYLQSKREREREKAVSFHNLRVFFYDLIMESDGWELSGMTKGEKDRGKQNHPSKPNHQPLLNNH